MNDLKGKAAIVTGASRGIGAATARELATHGVGVIVAARTAGEIEAIAAEIGDLGGRAEAVRCDVSVYDDLSKAVTRCRDAFGRLDILVNNAGIIEPIARLADSDPDRWGAATDINFKGVYHGLRAAIPVMEAQGAGVIVNISSGVASSPLEGWSQYCASKAAVLALTRCADKEYGDRGIRVVGLSPGTVATGMQIVIKASGVNPVSQLDPSAHIPAERVARAVAWLCNDGAADLSGVDVSLRDDEVRRRAGIDA